MARYGLLNAALAERRLHEACALGPDAEIFFSRAIDQMGLSGRAHDWVLRDQRTIVDLAVEEQIALEHVGEALNYWRATTVDR